MNNKFYQSNYKQPRQRRRRYSWYTFWCGLKQIFGILFTALAVLVILIYKIIKALIQGIYNIIKWIYPHLKIVGIYLKNKTPLAVKIIVSIALFVWQKIIISIYKIVMIGFASKIFQLLKKNSLRLIYNYQIQLEKRRNRKLEIKRLEVKQQELKVKEQELRIKNYELIQGDKKVRSVGGAQLIFQKTKTRFFTNNEVDLSDKEKIPRELYDFDWPESSAKNLLTSFSHLTQKQTKDFFSWVAKLVVPGFLLRDKNKPSLWCNFKILFKHPDFSPLRKAVVAWMIFVLVIGSSGIYSIIHSPRAQAANEFLMKTGYYLGTGASLSISGLGFQPELVIIKSDTAAGALVWKSTSMAPSATGYLGVATSNNTESEIIFDSDGFTVSNDLEVNTINTRYVYIAFAGSDCTADGTMCIGSYSGDGTASKAITDVGFQPDLVWVKSTLATAGTFSTSLMADESGAYFTATANNATGILFHALDATGFTVGLTNNTNQRTHHYVAFKNIAGKMAVGTFLGNGTDDRDIGSVGFEPDFVLVKQNSAIVPAFATTETWGDYSSVTTAAVNAVNHIQSLDADGFQVGNSTSVNANSITSHWFAFGGAADPAPTPGENFLMQRGSYEGIGVAPQTIDLAFAPDLVIIKGDTGQYAVFSTSLQNDLSFHFSLSSAGFANAITAMGASSFTVGTDNTVNEDDIIFEYIAFGNATSPHTGAGADNFFIGGHTGNERTGRAIDHLGVDPDMVVVKKTIYATTASARWMSSVMPANTSAYFSAVADVTIGTDLQTLNSDGFTVGAGIMANDLGYAHVWFGFKEGADFDVGSYSGEGVIKDVTGVGFSPDFVWTKRSSAINAVHRSSSITIAEGKSQHFNLLANDTNDITGFVADGFSVGTSAEVNTAGAGNTYWYAAWDALTSSNPPSTPTNSLPTNGATAQDLNATLTGSVYADPDDPDDAQTNAQWQVDDDSDFATPVWTRTAGAAEITTAVTSGNGTFANELSGKTELDHNSTYYWRVRYSDGAWSYRSTATNFVTNIFTTPTNSSPVDEATATTLTPTLTASAFSDAQGGHTAAYAQWQINTSNSFSSPLYDSGAVAYSASYAVPGAILSDRSTYYWRVRYQDSGGQWSEYSTATRFFISESEIAVKPLFGSTVVDQGDTIKIDAQLKLANGTVINDATTTISIYNPAGAKIVTDQSMSYISGSGGVYRYPYTVPATSGSYLYEVTAVSNGVAGYGAANFEVRTIAANVSSTQSSVEAMSTNVTNILEDTATTIPAQLNTATSTIIVEIDANETKIDTIDSNIDSLVSNVDILIAGLIVSQGTVTNGDQEPTATSFDTNLTNLTDDFYNNSIVTFTSGDLDGQIRRISDYNGSTKVITVDPALTFAPSVDDTFTIVGQNVRVEEQLAEHETAQSSFRTSTANSLIDITTTVMSIATTTSDIYSLLQTVDSKIDTVDTVIDALRNTQLKNYTATLSDFGEISGGDTYRAKVLVFDAEHQPMAPSSTPSILIYDSTRVLAQATTTMTLLSTGVYEYTYSVAEDATAGVWESVVLVDFAGTNSYLNDYWEVESSPAQVLISGMADSSVPSIAADVTIANEGSTGYEYSYEYCVVEEESNQCGGDDDTAYASAAKYLDSGEEWDTELSLAVDEIGDYYFKVVVYYGTEKSGASRFFTAVVEEVEEDEEDGGGITGGGGGSPEQAATLEWGPTLEVVYSEITDLKKRLGIDDFSANDKTLYQKVDVLDDLYDVLKYTANLLVGVNIMSDRIDVESPGFKSLLEITREQQDEIKLIGNKLLDLKTVSNTTRKIIEQQVPEPVIETWMTFGSIDINFLITNPSTVKQTLSFKAYLPQEVKPENIVNLDGLKIDFDANANTYYVYGEITLEPRETLTRNVKITDIWQFKDEKIASLKNQAEGLAKTLVKTNYDAQGSILVSEINSTLDIIKISQEESYSSPQEHIVVYRENEAKMEAVKSNLEKLKSLVIESGAKKEVVGKISGIQTFSTWGIVISIVTGFGLLALVLFSMWRHQMALAGAQIQLHKAMLDRIQGGRRKKMARS